MGRIDLKRWDEAPLFRKIAMGSWADANSASVLAQIDLDMTKTLKFVEQYSREKGVKITPTHLVGKAMAHVMKVRPEINGMIRGNRIFLRKDVDLFFSVNIPGQGDKGDKVGKASLSGATVFAAQDMSVAEIAQALNKKAEPVRKGTDKNFKSTFRLLKYLPWWGARAFLETMSFFLYRLNWDLSFLGFPKDPFGSVIISSIGGLGVEIAWAPLMNYSRVPILLTVGAIHLRPMVVDGKVEARPCMLIGVTFDHRFVDGVHAAHMAHEFKRCFEFPEDYLK